MKKKSIELNKKCKEDEQGRAFSSSEDGIITDPFGSWTGVDVNDIYEKPIQDADDL